MAVNVTVYDLDNYPDNSKTVTTDHSTTVPIGYEGDEQWVMSFTTSAYSDNTNTTAIQDIYVRDVRAGWAKSSGFAGNTFTVISGATGHADSLQIKMDNSSQYYTIDLDAGVNLSSEAVAADMQDKIRAIPDGGSWDTSDDGFILSYKNCIVDFIGTKFWIVSGSVARYYTGTSRTSVKVAKVASDVLYETLGFDIGMDSEAIASLSPNETLVTSSYTTDTRDLNVGTGTGVVAGSAMMITDGTNTDYFTAISGTTSTVVKVATDARNDYVGIANSYTANISKVQLLTAQDADSVPKAYYETVDAITRWGLMSVANQIDFSS